MTLEEKIIILAKAILELRERSARNPNSDDNGLGRDIICFDAEDDLKKIIKA